MDPLDLDPGDYKGSYKLVGGRPSLDLINTVSWPGTPRCHDWLDAPSNLKRWLAAEAVPHGKQLDLEVARRVRGILADALHPMCRSQRPSREAVDRLNALVVRAAERRVIDPHSLEWTWLAPETAIDVFAPVIFDAADLMANAARDRLRHCPSCDWVFLDQSKNGTRRWCDMADCGSRDKARRYYTRGKAAPAAAAEKRTAKRRRS